MAELDLVKLAEGRKSLEAWRTPEQFKAKIDELADAVDSEALFNRNETQFLRDAMTLETFIRYRTTENVRLAQASDQWPDGQIGCPEQPINIEVTEVLEEGRKRGNEYKDGAKPLDGDAEDWRRRALDIPVQLEKAIKRKKKKGYGKKCKLVIYLNMSNYGVLQKETEAKIAAIKAKHAADFQEICVLWQQKLL
ncbi:hypothetical protein H8A97_22960 [Bradyrhizobium sp. Arg62]|uniref:hypothetical protein n=1 Tax=Bradyrhizobium TaxID=374 RepID=UPI001E328DE7|nr:MULTISPECIES: hypothetical protein [Bradyrhizobium]MCC8937930.1 hypothetical protein [Bradyrhizobium ivorense]MCC8947889.1 hypothetical protein [Bradyrhizobium brasilense]